MGCGGAVAWVGNVPGAKGIWEEHWPDGESLGRRRGCHVRGASEWSKAWEGSWGPLWED